MAPPIAKLISLLTPKRSWFQFRLRTLFILTAAVAVPCAWLTWKIEEKRREREAIAAIIEAGGRCLHRWEAESQPHPPGPEWLRRLLGDDFFTTVERVGFRPGAKDLDAIMKNYIRDLTYLRMLVLHDSDITDEGLSNVQGLTNLQWLDLTRTSITDNGLKHVQTLTTLEGLCIDGTQVTDNGLKHLQGLTKLEVLWLQHTQLTDSALEHLRGLTALDELWLGETRVTKAGVGKLRNILPNCEIMPDQADYTHVFPDETGTVR